MPVDVSQDVIAKVKVYAWSRNPSQDAPRYPSRFGVDDPISGEFALESQEPAF